MRPNRKESVVYLTPVLLIGTLGAFGCESGGAPDQKASAPKSPTAAPAAASKPATATPTPRPATASPDRPASAPTTAGKTPDPAKTPSSLPSKKPPLKVIGVNKPGSGSGILPSNVAKDNIMKRLIEKCKKDLVGRKQVILSEIEVVEARRVNWPNSAAGCPEPGKMYMQAITAGTLIKLRAGGKMYNYHGISDKDPQYCANSTPPVSTGSELE